MRMFFIGSDFKRTSDDQQECDRKRRYIIKISYYLAGYHYGQVELNPVETFEQSGETYLKINQPRNIKAGAYILDSSPY